MSSLRRRYCWHSFSSEFTWVIPAEAHIVPKPAKPRCFAPHGTDSILSNIALGATFFFFGPALRGTAETSARPMIVKDLMFILPPLRSSCSNSTHKWEGRLSRPPQVEV